VRGGLVTSSCNDRLIAVSTVPRKVLIPRPSAQAWKGRFEKQVASDDGASDAALSAALNGNRYPGVGMFFISFLTTSYSIYISAPSDADRNAICLPFNSCFQ